jgi:hypothetical protein
MVNLFIVYKICNTTPIHLLEEVIQRIFEFQLTVLRELLQFRMVYPLPFNCIIQFRIIYIFLSILVWGHLSLKFFRYDAINHIHFHYAFHLLRNTIRIYYYCCYIGGCILFIS